MDVKKTVPFTFSQRLKHMTQSTSRYLTKREHMPTYHVTHIHSSIFTGAQKETTGMSIHDGMGKPNVM